MHGFDVHELLHSTAPGDDALRIVLISLWVFSNLGVILLLLMVGLESSVEELLGVGGRALAVALAGVIAPFAARLRRRPTGCCPRRPPRPTCSPAPRSCATSVGITARVLRDLGQMQSNAARVILGAAVIDDVLGLVILAVVVGVVASGGVELGAVAQDQPALGRVPARGALVRRARSAPAPRALLAALERRNAKLLAPLLLAFATAWLVNQIGLAAIIGAFAAGCSCATSTSPRRTAARSRCTRSSRRSSRSSRRCSSSLIGMQVNLALLADPATLLLGAALTSWRSRASSSPGCSQGPARTSGSSASAWSRAARSA